MNYISLLTQDEIAILCNLISGKGFKVLFQKNSKEFSKIKPGFRPNRIPEKEAVSLGIKHIDKTFISSFVNNTVESWLKKIDESYADLLSKGKNEDEAMAETLAGSHFSDNLDLYFKLIKKDDVDEKYIAKLRGYIAGSNIADRYDADIAVGQDANSVCSTEIEALREQLKNCEQQISDYESQMLALKEESISVKQELADAQVSVHSLMQDKQKMAEELADFKARVKYDDTERKGPTTIESREFDYISLCEVSEKDYTGQIWLNRLADIRKNGTIEIFYEDENMPKYFGNRSRIFFKDGPNEAGKIGVWNWKAIPNNNDSSRDYVTAEFNPDIDPIEIVIVRECNTAKELIEKIKTGIDVEITSRRIIFAACLSNLPYIGILCQSSDLEQNGKQTRLNNKVISLPRYNITEKDLMRLSNNKIYYRSVRIGIPAEIVNVKDPLDIVKTIVISRNSWQVFKQQGKTRSEWKNIRDFLDGLDSTVIIDDIIDVANCSHEEAQKMLDNFVKYAESYIDGTSIEDGIISAVIASNSELMERCKTLIKDDWIVENKASVDEANAQLNELRHEIKETQARLEKQKSEAEKELAAMQGKRNKLEADLKTLSATISEKERFAADVEAAVAQRICQAQNNAADFIASLAFVPKATLATPETTAVPSIPVAKTQEERLCYVQGTQLNSDNLENVDTWKDMLDVISDELIEAGVATKISLPLAAYMYAAYITKSSLLMVGPNADAIADAFSGAVFGKLAGILDCKEKYSAQSVEACYASEDHVVKIVNPFSANWIGRLPDIVSRGNKFFIALHPYTEDIQIEPKSLYSYMLPIFTDLFIEKLPTGRIMGGCCTADYKEFGFVEATRTHNKLLAEMHTSSMVRNRIQTLLDSMHTMLKDPNIDYDVMFALLPYAYATMQTSLILNATQDAEKKSLSISKGLIALIDTMYGENE